MRETALSRQFGTAALLRFALPNIAMMVFLSLYTIVDGIFISRYVGTLALSAVNMSYPLNSLQMALGIMLGTGGSAIIARELGEGKERRARGGFYRRGGGISGAGHFVHGGGTGVSRSAAAAAGDQ